MLLLLLVITALLALTHAQCPDTFDDCATVRSVTIVNIMTNLPDSTSISPDRTYNDFYDIWRTLMPRQMVNGYSDLHYTLLSGCFDPATPNLLNISYMLSSSTCMCSCDKLNTLDVFSRALARWAEQQEYYE